MTEQHTTHSSRSVERSCDVAVVGGSAAGLAAALQLVRQRRSVIVIDSGAPRNAPAAHVHGFIGFDGHAPSAITAAGRDDVRRYGGEILDGTVVEVERADDVRLRLELTGGHAILARRAVVATGLVDELPAIDGLAEHWGGDVIHCPFCHGYEVRDRRIVQIVTHPMGLHPARLFRQLTDRLTIVLHDADGIDQADVGELRGAGVDVVDGRVARIATGDDGRVAAVELADGRRVEADAVAVGPRFHPRIEPFASLGLSTAAHPSGLGDVVDTDETGATNVAGVFAAGNAADPALQVLHAAADGSRVGAMVAFSLADEDTRAATRPSPNSDDWDRRYSGDRIWSGNPNGTLVQEVADLAPGTALDIGAGEGGDAVWLAQTGWRVTASDVTRRGLDRVAEAAELRGVDVECLHADANSPHPYGSRTFDLVSAQYASIARTPDRRGERNMIEAVASGGTLVVVGHDLEPMRTPIDVTTQSRGFDPDAYVRVDDVAATLAESPDWDVEVFEKRPRPPGATSAAHHVDDVVLRARRID